MKLIGKGVQYTAFDIGNGRVKKILNTAEEARKILGDWGIEPDKATHQAETSVKLSKESTEKVHRLIKEYPDVGLIFGNPSFEGDGSYTQDKVKILGPILENSTPSKAQHIFSEYAKLLKLLWAYGLSECVFNLTINNGKGSDNSLILLDFSELSFDKMSAAKNIENEKWLRAWSYNRDLDTALKDEYRRIMKENLTLSVLNSIWGKNLNAT